MVFATLSLLAACAADAETEVTAEPAVTGDREVTEEPEVAGDTEVAGEPQPALMWMSDFEARRSLERLADELGLLSVGQQPDSVLIHDTNDYYYHGTAVADVLEFTDDFNGDGVSETLVLSLSYDSGGEYETNKPVSIVFRLGDGPEAAYADEWNDGVWVYVTDFDRNDPYKAIYIFSSGTDVDGYSTIYPVGGGFGECIEFPTLSGGVYFDGHGRIYYARFVNDLRDYIPELRQSVFGHYIFVLDIHTGVSEILTDILAEYY